MTAACTTPVSLTALIDYLAGDLEPDREAGVEEHFFGCRHCAARLETVERLGAAVAGAVAAGRAAMPVTGDVVERVAAAGLTVREYAIEPGGLVPCTVAPDDDLVVVRLHGRFGDGAEATVEVAARDLDAGTARQLTIPAVIDRRRGQVVLLFRGDEVRTYPRSHWTMHVALTGPGRERHRLGPYVMDHTPWHRLPA